MRRRNRDTRISVVEQRLSAGCLLVAMLLSACLALNSHAENSNRRQVIVFTTPDSKSGKLMQASVDAQRCQLIDRETDVRFVDVSELIGVGASSTSDEPENPEMLVRLARLRGDERPDFEVVLIGKDGGVKARTNNPNALEDLLALIDTMPMRRTEMRLKEGAEDGCK